MHDKFGMRKDKLQITELLFCLILFSASITGVGYFLYCITHGIIQYTFYPEAIMNGAGITAKVIRYSKDYITVALFMCLAYGTFQTHRMPRFLVIFALICAYGSMIGIVHGLGMAHFVSGVRSVLYFITGVWFFWRQDLRKQLIDVILRLTDISLILNLLSVFVMIAMGARLPGTGSYRYIGLFLHTGTLANYAYAIALFYGVCFTRLRRISLYRSILSQIGCIFLCVASNSRLCIMGALVNLIITVLSATSIRKIQKIIFSGFSLVLVVPIILESVLVRSGRGDLTASAGGKLGFWSEAFSQKLPEIIFGNGFGYATQTTVIIRGGAGITFEGFDGTLSVVMAQFGLIGLVVFIIFFALIIYRIITCPNFDESIFKLNLACGITIFAWSGNIFENIIMCLYCILIYYIIYSPIKCNAEIEENK